ETADGRKVEVPPNLKGEDLSGGAGDATTNHVRDFVNCVKSRRQPRANALAACQTHIACHAAYIASHVGRKLRFDPAHDTFINDAEANRMRSRALRDPWQL